MANIKVDSKQETGSGTTGAHVICFADLEVKEAFSTALNSWGVRTACLEIAVVKSDGSFEGKMKP